MFRLRNTLRPKDLCILRLKLIVADSELQNNEAALSSGTEQWKSGSLEPRNRCFQMDALQGLPELKLVP